MPETETLNSPAAAKPRFFYGYVIITTVFWIMVIAQGLFMSFGVFFTPIATDMGWLRSALSGPYSAAFIVMGVMNIILGRLGDRLGPRKVVTAGIILFGVGHILMSRVQALWQMYLFYPIISTGQSTTDVVLLSTLARWFNKRRGIMSGIAKVGTGLGMLIMPVAITWLIARSDWRNAYVVLGTLVLVTTIPLCQLLRKDPADVGQFPDGDRQVAEGTLTFDQSGLTVRQAMGSRHLWAICFAWLTGLFCIQSILVHITPYAIDSGIAEVHAASVLSTLGAVSILGRLVIGYTGDRISNRRGLMVCFGLFALALVWLQFARDIWALYPFAAVWGFAQGGMITALSPVVAEMFGTRAHGTLLGVVFSGGTVGGAIGPLLAGYIFDATGSYRLDFVILLVLALIGLYLTSTLKPTVRKTPDGKQF
ncbi:MAG: MFS transporter [Dehalococcoidales bacterium]|nr:MFS transporter [Dehalococcoidales bacterium]